MYLKRVAPCRAGLSGDPTLVNHGGRRPDRAVSPRWKLADVVPRSDAVIARWDRISSRCVGGSANGKSALDVPPKCVDAPLVNVEAWRDLTKGIDFPVG
ncbi:hypothetical protein [Burkholderia cenocepacia]|uniref:hypothetical protein n=1 Tax=Burkholderia cenocepacia TaxID=95486 RepID=UPI0013DF1071|nr:hypothetical protein [Burkholderia cenocepacia]